MSFILAILVLSVPVFIAGFSVSFYKPRLDSLKLLLSLSASFLITITCTHLLPEVFENTTSAKGVGLFILFGFLLQIFLENLTQGIEHGHLHTTCGHKKKQILPLSVGLFLHSFLEGIPAVNEASYHLGQANSALLIGTTLHNIPIAISFFILLMDSRISKLRMWSLFIIFCILPALGCLTGILAHNYLFHQTSGGFDLNILNYLKALVIGIFLHVSTTILFESEDHHHYNLKKTLIIALGIGLGLLI